MKIETLMESLPENYNFVDREMVMKAYKFAEKAHEGQTRVSGEPYITHCVSVAAILAELKVPPAVLIAGLLHDTVEDSSTTTLDIKNNFGEEITKTRRWCHQINQPSPCFPWGSDYQTRSNILK